MAPAKKVPAKELAKIYLANSGSSNPIVESTEDNIGTKMIPPPTPSNPLRKPPKAPNTSSNSISV